jgi:hypothetical protein
MPPPSDPRLLVLHALRLKGFAEATGAADLSGLPGDDVEKQLDALADEQLVIHRDGRLSGWSLTPAGRTEHERLLAKELADVGGRDDVERAYHAFLELNGELLAVCTAWQMKGEALNDHTDEEYDRGVIDRLLSLHASLGPILDGLTACLGRYEGYAPRFDAAIGRLRAGDRDYFTKPMIDSYHTVWFELHEDLLATLGVERAKEAWA